MEAQKTTFTFHEVCTLTHLDENTLIAFIQREWITPCEQQKMDEEDLARIRLIEDLQRTFGVNDESIPVILHLIDQLHFLKNKFQSSSV